MKLGVTVDFSNVDETEEYDAFDMVYKFQENSKITEPPKVEEA